MVDYKVPVLENFQWQKPVKDKDLSTSPGGEAKGDRYIVATIGSGAWTGHTGDIALYNGATWEFITKTEGMVAWVEDENLLYIFNGTTWITHNLDKITYNLMLAFFKISIQGGLVKYNLVDGIMDEFEDESGVDVGTSTNESYDAVNDLYSPSTSDILKDNRWVAVDNRVGLSRTFSTLLAYPVTPSTSFPLSKIDIQLNKVNTPTGNMWVEIWSDNGSDDPLAQIGIDSSILDVSTVGSDTTHTFTFSTPITLISGTKYWIVLNDNRGTDDVNYIEWCGNIATLTTKGHYYNGAVWYNWNDVTFNYKLYSIQINNMTLVSNVTVAEAVPTRSRIVIMEEDVDSININTDLKAYISRDNGSNWTQHTLTDEGDYDTGKRILVSEAIDISGQPSGSNVKWKVETLNNKDLKLHGIGLNWN